MKNTAWAIKAGNYFVGLAGYNKIPFKAKCVAEISTFEKRRQARDITTKLNTSGYDLRFRVAKIKITEIT